MEDSVEAVEVTRVVVVPALIVREVPDPWGSRSW